MKSVIETYEIKKPQFMSQTQYRHYLGLLALQLWRLEREGWSKKAVQKGYLSWLSRHVKADRPIRQQLAEHFVSLHQAGSPLFQRMWRQETSLWLSSSKARHLLGLFMAYLNMPEEITGSQEQTKVLLSRLFPDLSPDAPFWAGLSRLVRKAYPGNSLADLGGDRLFKRQIHQLRYLISAHQAQWVRDRYRQEGMTDKEALAVYLSKKTSGLYPLSKLGRPFASYDLATSSRLHNKRAGTKDGQVIYPDNLDQVNLKILMHFHTEFIISQTGCFLNILDPEGSSQNAVLNGASFNYAGISFKAHQELDVATVSPHDPAFRARLAKNAGLPFKNPSPKAYKDPRDTIFASNQKSLSQRVTDFKKAFQQLIRSKKNRV